jgi:hypothetical protein
VERLRKQEKLSEIPVDPCSAVKALSVAEIKSVFVSIFTGLFRIYDLAKRNAFVWIR